MPTLPNRSLPRARLARRLRAALLPLLAGALVCAGAGAVRAQSFFAESDALREETSVGLTLSDLTEHNRTTTTSTNPVDFSDVDSSARRVDGRYRMPYLAVGATAETRRFHQVTETFALRDDRDQSAAYAALVLTGLATDEDQLNFVLSTSGRHERFAYDGYERRLDSKVGHQGGIVYRIGWVILGYTRGTEELQLRIVDPTMAFVQEFYRFDYGAILAGLQLGDPEKLGALLVWQRKDTPGVAGTTIDLEAGVEELQRVEVTLGLLRLHYSQTHGRKAFTGESQRDSTEREFSLGIEITKRLGVALSQRRVNDLQGFTLLGIPSTGRNDRTENLIRFGLRF